MLSAFFSKVFQERRRLTFVSTMAFLAGFLFYLNADLYIHGVHVAFVTGAIYAAVVGAAAMLICLFLPSMRFMIEAVAVSRFGLSLFVLAFPQIGFQILASPLLTAFLVVTGGALISRLIHGRIQQQKRPGWGRLLPAGSMFERAPQQLQARNWQFRFVAWMDDAVPVRA